MIQQPPIARERACLHPHLRLVQRARQGAVRLAPLLLVVLAQACATTRVTGDDLAPTRQRGRFVPASAYEAYVRGELLLASGDARAAVPQLELATTAPDEDAYLLSRLAEAHAQSGDRRLAEQALQEAERVNACEQNVWLTRGRWAEQDGQLEQAVAAYERALRCDSNALPAALALHRALTQTGRAERSLTVLSEIAARSTTGAQASFEQALRSARPAEVRFALDSLLSVAVPEPKLMDALLARALTKREPSLLLLMAELPVAKASAAQLRLRRYTQDRAGARALLAQLSEQQLGGPAQAAEDALFAGDVERAELYATLALQREPTPALSALHVRALLGLGEAREALGELRSVSSAQRAPLVGAALEQLGFPALSAELTNAVVPVADQKAGGQ